jgi:hypothetical protein
MEYAFLQTGHLLPSFHKSYWLGLTTASSEAWPLFTWTDQNVPGPMDHYTHWGTAVVEGWPTPEPNNQDFPELCATGNFAQAYGFPSAWGWGDASCKSKAVVVCRRLREWRANGCASSSPPCRILHIWALACRVSVPCTYWQLLLGPWLTAAPTRAVPTTAAIKPYSITNKAGSYIFYNKPMSAPEGALPCPDRPECCRYLSGQCASAAPYLATCAEGCSRLRAC